MKKIIYKYSDFVSLNEGVPASPDYDPVKAAQGDQEGLGIGSTSIFKPGGFDEYFRDVVMPKTLAGYMDKSSITEDMLEAKRRVIEATRVFLKYEPTLYRWIPLINFINIYISVDELNCPTAWTNCKDSIWFNPYYVMGLSKQELSGLILHEMYHIAWQHADRAEKDPRKQEEARLWNIAADYALNYAITLEPSYVTNRPGNPSLALASGGMVSNTFGHQTADQIFDILYKYKKNTTPPGKKPKIDDQPGNGGGGKPIPWEDVPDEIKKILEEENKQQVKDVDPGKSGPDASKSSPVKLSGDRKEELDKLKDKLRDKYDEMAERIEKNKRERQQSGKNKSNNNGPQGNQGNQGNDDQDGSPSGGQFKPQKRIFRKGDVVKDNTGRKYRVEEVGDMLEVTPLDN